MASDRKSSFKRSVERARIKAVREIERVGTRVTIYRHVMDDDGFHGKIRAADEAVYENLPIAISNASLQLAEVHSDGGKVYSSQPTALIASMDELSFLKNDYFVIGSTRYEFQKTVKLDETDVVVQAHLVSYPLEVNEGGES